MKTLFWAGGGGAGGSAINYWLLCQYLLQDTISIFLFFLSFDLIEFCFAERGCGRVSSLPNRLSSYVFFFLVNKRFQAQIAFNYKQPQVLR